MPPAILEKSIVPIVRAEEGNPFKELLGTGFLVGPEGDLKVVTAKHVVEGVHLAPTEQIAIAFREETQVKIISISGCHASAKYDIAVIDAPELSGAVPLRLASNQAPQNFDILAYEYSSSHTERLPSGITQVSVEPLMHKGNVMRHYVSRFPEATPTPALLTSFPALQGASGAPVLLSHNGAVIGMLVANYERHLLPAQTIRVSDERGSSEEISYFLPLGKAIQSGPILEVLDELGVVIAKIPWDYGLHATAASGAAPPAA